MGFSKGWQGCSEEFPEGEAQGKSRGAALPARGKPRPSRLSKMFFRCSSLEDQIYGNRDDKLQILTQLSFHKFVVLLYF